MRLVRHNPQRCSSCGAAVYFAQVLDDRGRVVRREDGRPKLMPVDVAPARQGNAVLFDRSGTIVVRVLHAGEAPPAGGKLRVSHFVTCRNAAQHRRSRGGRACVIV